ncbi:hypothetical protein [Pseudonocardia yuanmonensis]|uniref:hypothetical protein n=1 Tax=Pseudonocardia yuanmonensis TaxID=1095914 RepID=UPI0031E8ACA7
MREPATGAVLGSVGLASADDAAAAADDAVAAQRKWATRPHRARRDTTESVVDPRTGLTTQQTISAEIARIAHDYERSGQEETQPRLGYPPYRSSLLRHPRRTRCRSIPRASSCERRASVAGTSTRSRSTSPSSAVASPSASAWS